MDWTKCTSGACGGSKYAMLVRMGWSFSKTTPEVCFSNDTIHWSRLVSTKVDGGNVGTVHHNKPGVVAVPGGLVSSQAIGQCPLGTKPRMFSCDRKPTDVVRSGMGLFASKDGL